MSWTTRLTRLLRDRTSRPASRSKKPHARRVLVEPLEDRRLLSVAGAPAAAEYDFGDLPDNYGTTLAADGARHQATGPTLGAARDCELDGLPTIGAEGDDSAGIADEGAVDFENGVAVGQYFAVASFSVQAAPNGAKLDAWIDYNGNGSFDPDEQIFDSIDVTEGRNRLLFNVPDSALPGETYARFRLSTTGDLTPTGPANDGEVEDYQLTIDPKFPAIPTEDLGEIDYRLMAPLSYRDQSYAFTSARDGYVTIEASIANVFGEPFSNPVALILRDSEGNVLQKSESSDSYVRIDHLAPSGNTDYVLDIVAQRGYYFPAVVGGSPRIYLRICNLVSPSGPNVDVFGTSESDTFAFALSDVGNVSVNDVEYSFDASQTGLISFLDHEGSDALTIGGIWGDESAQLVPGAVEVQADGIDLRVQAHGVEHITVNGGGGYLLEMIDGADNDTFGSIMAGQLDASVTVNAPYAPSGTKLDAWIDFNGDGAFEASEQIAAAHVLVDGDNRIAFDVPSSAVSSQSFVRFRTSTDGNLTPDGAASDGDTDDYSITILSPTVDFGDAPDNYGTTLATDGARHEPTGPTLGATRDVEADGLPTVAADGDGADEDGITFSSIMVGQLDATATVNVQNAPSGAKLDAWIDFNGDGSFGLDEQIADTVDVSEGYNPVSFNVPDSATAGQTYARFRLSSAGDLTPTGPADDGEVEDYQVTIDTNNLDAPPIDLGAIDFRELSGVDLSAGPKVYSFATTYAGYLTVRATFDSAGGNTTLRLIDGDKVLGDVTATDGYARIDHLDLTAGKAYALQVTGANSDVDLRFCNLVEVAEGAVTVHGTSGDDQFEYAAGRTLDVTINQLGYEFVPASIDSVHFDGGLGTNGALLIGTASQETASFSPGSGSMTTTATGFVVSVENAPHIIVSGGGGMDTVELNDSTGDDTLIATPMSMAMSGTLVDGTPYSLHAADFRYTHGYAKNGGNDTAQLTGSENKERVKPYTDFVKLIGSSYFHRTKFFETTTVDTLGGTDNGVMMPSTTADAVWAMKNDIRIARDVAVPAGESPDYADLTYDVTIANCEYFLARAAGNDDWLELHDSLGKDVLLAKPHKIQIMDGPDPDAGTARGSEYKVTARGFYHATSVADQGGDNDSAKLYDSAEDGVDIWAAAYVDGETWSTMSSPTRLLYEVLAFEHVGGYGYNGGLGEDHGTNRKEHTDDVDFVFQYGHWEEP